MKISHRFDPGRRAVLKSAAALAAVPAVAGAQPARPPAPRSLMVAQLVDTSASQQDVSKDFLIGARAAWQDINARGGLRGRAIEHLSVEVDGTPAATRAALQPLLANPACLVLSGTAGDPVASQVVAEMQRQNTGLAHVAPWLQNSTAEIDERTFPIFAARQAQISHALSSLTAMGVQEIGVVFASPRDRALYHEDLGRIAAALKLRLHAFGADVPLSQLGQRLTPGTPALLLFVGGTPELVQFTASLEKQQRQRYIVALADVNLQTMVQMGGARATPVIATQPVPLVTAGLPVVRAYRETLGRLFDEPPAPLSLAGFIAARYTYEVLADVQGPLTRATALAAFQRRAARSVGGYRVNYDARRHGGSYVTQSMLTLDGRVVG